MLWQKYIGAAQTSQSGVTEYKSIGVQSSAGSTTFTFTNVDFGDYYPGRTIIISSISYGTISGPSTGLTIDGIATTHTLAAGNFVPAGSSILAFSCTRSFTGRYADVVLTTQVNKTSCSIAVYTTPNQVSLTPVSTNSQTFSSGTSASFSNVTTQSGDIVIGMTGLLSTTATVTYTGGLVFNERITLSPARYEASSILNAPSSTRTIGFTWSSSSAYRVGYGIFR